MESRAFLVLALAALLSIGTHATKPKVDLYVESLCPFCRRFVIDVLKPLYDEGLTDAMDFHIYYCGNAHLYRGTLRCQHGRFECFYNKYLECGIAHIHDIHVWLPFISCVEKAIGSYVVLRRKVEDCATAAGLEPNDVRSCALGEEGQKLHIAAYNKTEALYPPHEWVPWLVIDGKHAQSPVSELVAVLCKNTPEESQPERCKDFRYFESENELDQVCRRPAMTVI